MEASKTLQHPKAETACGQKHYTQPLWDEKGIKGMSTVCSRSNHCSASAVLSAPRSMNFVSHAYTFPVAGDLALNQ